MQGPHDRFNYLNSVSQKSSGAHLWWHCFWVFIYRGSVARLHVSRWACLAPHWLKMPTLGRAVCLDVWSFRQLCVMMQSNPETNSVLFRIHSKFFLSSSDFHPHLDWGHWGSRPLLWGDLCSSWTRVQERVRIWSCQLCVLCVSMSPRKALIQGNIWWS